MHIAVGLLSLAVTVLVVASVARRLDLPAPILLVAVGIAGSYLPFVPEFRLTPEIVLLGLLPPLLYGASLQTSLLDFNAQRRAILGLSVGLVAFTTVGVALIVHLVLPGVDWPAAFAIGAVVAPPDAVAATAVARRIGMPRRIVTVLEGESLLNDATALVSLKTALLAASVSVSMGDVAFDFLRTALGGVAVGLGVVLVVGWVRTHVTDPVMDTSVSIVTPFAAYVAAEEIGGSGVLAVVVAGLLLGHKAPVLQSASSRISERVNWRTVTFLLENAVFLLIGLQTRRILADVGASEVGAGRIAFVCTTVFAAVVVLRLLWVFPMRYVVLKPGPDGRRSPIAFTVIVGWAGMRGVVTLAAAFAIPLDFPRSEVLVLIALVVTAGTLTLQGLSLPWLVRRLRVPGPDPREDALARAELLQQASTAGLAALDGFEDTTEQHEGVREVLRSRLEQRDFAAWERLGTGADIDETPSERYGRLRLEMLRAERQRVLEIRSSGRVDHEVVEDVLSSLDIEESMIGYGLERRREFVAHMPQGASVNRAMEACEHLDAVQDRDVPDVQGCEDCLVEGTTWVHLRMCLSCGHIGCCDSSPRRHASGHFGSSDHPVMRSVEPGEDWRWCFVDEIVG